MDFIADARRDRSTTRRELVRVCSAVAITSVAGCLSSDDDGESDNNSPGSEGDDSSDGGNGDDTDGERTRLESGDGWQEPHDGVEIPDDPGTAILEIGGETVTLTGIATGGEVSEDDISTTGAEQFEIQGSFQGGQYRETQISVNFTRMLGYEDTSGRWAESDAFSLVRGDGIRLGNVIYRLYEDGRLANDDIAGELDGRRFTDESFIHANRNGIVTIVEEIDSHEDDSFDGRFEFGARLSDDWNEL
ncbi:hypothetical protein OB955_16095 [Halobacteria archaeon AArc-m2/3/4]|uniref:Uncharacterized protein n=1 Tax=Natronoglomus mannanivorans TaxID=2979990 RepID=A0AAP2Z6D8_9EURY|nr:hypothetical protein [Halobacteria archaeon AArc-xg1-1]MCU4974248.1 hypothetical protein [Halobacteria archaeon AArc-m2/3/4]